MGRDQFTFAHIADAHVGAWARNPALRDRLRQGVLRAIEVAQERGAEFLLISGDLFHTPVPEPSEVAPVAAALRRFVESGRRIYVIYGSHDYVAHRTSWLDVLAEAGVFVRVAPEAVRSGEASWTLPWTEDVPTGARIAGVSGRSHGLDRDYYRSMDSSAFEAEPGFRIFQFHAGVEEYLPTHLRDKIKGIRVENLPAGVEYYAGGHIHFTYEGAGPGGGLLINPGAVFGTSRTDIENGEAGRTHRGVVIVTVTGKTPRAEFVDTLERGGILTLDVDISGAAPEAISELIAARVREAAPARRDPRAPAPSRNPGRRAGHLARPRRGPCRPRKAGDHRSGRCPQRGVLVGQHALRGLGEHGRDGGDRPAPYGGAGASFLVPGRGRPAPGPRAARGIGRPEGRGPVHARLRYGASDGGSPTP